MEITTKIGCPVFCAYCPQKKLLEAYSGRSHEFLMSFDTFKTCVDKIPLKENLWFCGMCEPFSNPDCTKMILYARQRGHRISVSTTLAGLNSADIDLLEQISLGGFGVHLPSTEGLEKINIDEKYLEMLTRILESKLPAYFFAHTENVDPRVLPLFRGRNVEIQKRKLITRAGNVESMRRPRKRIGVLRCERGMRSNILLPNGDVALCCMDYGLQHVLGNLLRSDYNSLHQGEEFLKVQKGLRDVSSDILCRKCDQFAREILLIQWMNVFIKRIASMLFIKGAQAL